MKSIEEVQKIREIRQAEAVKAYLESDGRSIINGCPRLGKIKCAIDIMRAKGYNKPLIAAPRKDIEKGWIDDFIKFGFKGTYRFTTFSSLKKTIPGNTEILILDEPHELSKAQQAAAEPLVRALPTLGLTGTITQKTREELYESLNLDVCYKYSIDEGVKDGILTDYQIFIHKVPLNSSKLSYRTKRRTYTEKSYFDLQKFLRQDATNKFFFDLKMIRIIQNSEAKRLRTKELLDAYGENRILVFCGTTQVADNLGIAVYHSLSREKQIFLDFCAGSGPRHLATIKMMQAGITIQPIGLGIMNYMSGSPEESAQKICRFLGFEYNNPTKKAEIHIISSDEDFEVGRLKTGLAFFDQTKIHITN